MRKKSIDDRFEEMLARGIITKNTTDTFDAFKKLCEEEAYSRKDYKDNVVNVVNGAAGSWFKCKLNDKLDLMMEHRKHWEDEWRGELGLKLETATIHEVKFSNKSKPDALQEVQKNLHVRTTRAANTMADYTNSSRIKMLKELNAKDKQDFIDLVENRFDEILAK